MRIHRTPWRTLGVALVLAGLSSGALAAAGEALREHQVAAGPSPAPTTATAPTVPAAETKPVPAAAGVTSPQRDPYALPYEKYTLDNGLEIILHRDPSLPLVAVNLWYHVGPANEAPGRSGFAHLFEHLMFEGSKHAGTEFDELLESVGASNVNGTTSWDRTNYFETVPRHELELALWLESDRMGYLLDAITQERLDVQRDVVKNERRQRYENAPYGQSELAMYDALFPASHPYHGAVIGSMEDLTRASLSDVQAFFRAFYAPSNATLALAGDFDPARVKAWIEHYFATLPKTPRPVAPRLQTPPLTSVVRKEVKEPVQLARVAIGFLTPPAYTPADTTLDLVATLLAGGKATRLYQALVVKKKLASDVSAENDSNELTSMFGIDATVLADKRAADVERAIDEELQKLATSGPTVAELDRAKRRIRLHVLDDLQRLDGDGGESGRAGTLQRLNHYTGSPGGLEKYIARLDATTADDVRRVVKEQLSLGARAIVTTVPETTSPSTKTSGAH